MHHFPKITIGLVLHGINPHLKVSLQSLVEQDYPNCEFLVRDQSPKGEAYDFIKKELPNLYDQIQIEKGENLWHSGGHNKLINKMTGEYYLCCSNDMWYPPHFITAMMKEFSKPEFKKVGSATCKLMVWDFKEYRTEHIDASHTFIIDSCGLGIKKNHYFYDVGQGEEDRHQYDHKKHIFGASGALAIYRKQALDDIAYQTPDSKLQTPNSKEYFDKLIHYKNDVDLAYRLQWAGWPCLFIPEVKVYHDRLTSNKAKSPSLFVRILRGRKGKMKWVKESSFFGHQATLVKNFSDQFSLWVRLRTTAHQWGRLLFTAVFEPYVLKQLHKLKKHEKELIDKRAAVERKVSAQEIEKLMN